MLSALCLSVLAQLSPLLATPPRPLTPPIGLASLARPLAVPRLAQPPPIVRYAPPPPPRRRASTVVTYWVDSLPGRSLDHAWGLTRHAASKWAAVADLDLVPARSRQEATVIVHPETMWGHWLGLTTIGSPRSLKAGRTTGLSLGIQTHFRGNDELLTSVLTHEFGHALGMNHTRMGHTMGPAVSSTTPFTEHDAGYVVNLYGQREGN